MEIDSDFRHPPLEVSVASLERHFASATGRARATLRNPHLEPRVDEEAWRRATPAAVLVPIVRYDERLGVLLTRRHHSISYPGHVCFPGGRADPADRSPEDTALREAEEEIALARDRVRVLGCLGDYVTHSGFRITPVVGIVEPPLELVPAEGEVEEIIEFELSHLFDARSYRLRRHSPEAERAHFFLEYEGAMVTGPTVSLMMGFYEELLKTHPR